MTGAALLLALAAAVVHAAWNLLLAREEDPRAATSAALAVGMLALAPFSLVYWDVQPDALPYAAGSAVLELAYLALLALAYAKHDLSAVHPTAPGSAPVLALLVSVAFLGGAAAPLGILVVAAAPVPYLLLTLGPAALVHPLFVRPRFTWAAAVAGLGMVGGYLLVLAALEAGTREDVAAVAAVVVAGVALIGA